MRKHAISIALLISCLSGAVLARGQEATERYIPIGQSPGLSRQYNYMGPIDAVDAENRTLTIAGPSGARVVKLTERTRIWLDRSMLESTSSSGSFEDCLLGRTVEVKYEDPSRRELADWIKVQITRPQPSDE
jgi:hypothetical protein